MANSTTMLSNPMEDPLSPSNHMSSSLSSLSSSRSSRNGPSEISKTYRQASALFLTRRMDDALSILEPIISSSASTDEEETRESEFNPAPIATASRNSRIKIWSLYLTLLDAIINLGAEEGRNTFGSQKWRELVSKGRDGKVWEDVIRHGYHNIEGDVDADVVINLATLLLNHAPSQTVNQQRLETYLSASANPNLDISERLRSKGLMPESGTTNGRPSPAHGGTNTPRDLNARTKILELYTLHVLPRNEEWEYAKDFITISEILDEEKREAFLHTLQSLQNEKDDDAERELEIQRDRLEQQERQKREAEARAQEIEKQSHASADAVNERNPAASHKRTSSETDYGIESHPKDSNKSQGPKNGPRSRVQAPGASRLSPPSKAVRKPGKPTNLYRRASILMSSVNQLAISMAQSMKSNPVLLLRSVLFLLAFIFALSRRDTRDRIRRITSSGWNKVRGTVGMGVKVSYI
ncbi:MAG: hypothetical protein M4579_001357 [Chaenotheca gracillima]|nr:MAG: hypothetical protein M4579_001357 [Chaenotheca gracillima]